MFLPNPDNHAESGGGGNRTRDGFPHKRARRPESLVYFIQAGEDGPIKIGTTGDLESRLNTLQAGSPARLHVLATVRDQGSTFERRLHLRLKAYRLRGEWFTPHADVLEAVAAFTARDVGVQMRALVAFWGTA